MALRPKRMKIVPKRVGRRWRREVRVREKVMVGGLGGGGLGGGGLGGGGLGGGGLGGGGLGGGGLRGAGIGRLVVWKFWMVFSYLQC
ncbi:hypothetical protein EAE99_011835 [Botrytis elliptica]|nr:hypothetical protein EAE99_011835 [Botrytis elliptica]